MPRTATASGYTYLDCPACGQGIAEPIALGLGPMAFVHGHGTFQCRLIIQTGPSEDSDHRAWRVPHNISLEQALEAAQAQVGRG